MGDERLRELERRWIESGTVEDRVAYLRERLRSGMIVAEHVMGAAILGHSAAMVALDFRAPPVSQDRRMAAVVKNSKVSSAVVLSWLLEDVTAPLEMSELEIGSGLAILSLARAMRYDLQRVVTGIFPPPEVGFEQRAVGVPLVSRLDVWLLGVAHGLSCIVRDRADGTATSNAVLQVNQAMEQLLRERGLPRPATAARLAERLLL